MAIEFFELKRSILMKWMNRFFIPQAVQIKYTDYIQFISVFSWKISKYIKRQIVFVHKQRLANWKDKVLKQWADVRSSRKVGENEVNFYLPSILLFRLQFSASNKELWMIYGLAFFPTFHLPREFNIKLSLSTITVCLYNRKFALACLNFYGQR